MPSANEAELARVFTSSTGGAVSEESIASSQPFDIVAQAEAGQTLFNGGGPFKLIAVLRDLSNNTVITVPGNPFTGTLRSTQWPNRTLEHHFALPAQGATRQDHIYKASVVLTIGVADPIVDAEESDLLVITE